MTITNWVHIAEVIGEDADFVPSVANVLPMIAIHDQHAMSAEECVICTPGPGDLEWSDWQHGNPLADVPPAEPWTPRRSS